MATMRHDADLALVPVRQSDRPSRFESWPEDVKERCRDLWSSVGNRNASRVEWLYGREVPDHTAIPAAATIRRWAYEGGWGEWADGELRRTRGKTLRQLQNGWLHSLLLSQETLIDAMLGRFADSPGDGAVRVKAAEALQRAAGQAGLLGLLGQEPEPETIDLGGLSLEEGEAAMREALQAARRQKGFG